MKSPEEQIRDILHAAFEEAGAIVADGIKNGISTIWQGKHPIQDYEGQPALPHLRSGELQAGILYSVDEFWDGLFLTIASDAPYSVFLRDGTYKMLPRDFFGQEMADRWTPLVVSILQKHFGPIGSAPLNANQQDLADLFGIEFEA